MSLNQITLEQCDLPTAVELCVRHGVGSISLWRHKVAEYGLAKAVDLLRDSGLRVSALCRGGMFPATDDADARARIDDNLRAVDEAAQLGADALVLVCGPAPDRDLARARTQVLHGIEAVLPHARAAGVPLGIEPLHPMMISQRSVVVTLGQANDLVDALGEDHLGVVVDAYHVWWDPDLAAQLRRSTGRIKGFHVSDWLEDTRDLVYGRGLMGEGVIDLPALSAAVEEAGWIGPVEVEILNRELWERDPDVVMSELRSRFEAHV